MSNTCHNMAWKLVMTGTRPVHGPITCVPGTMEFPYDSMISSAILAVIPTLTPLRAATSFAAEMMPSS